MLYTMIIKAIL